MSLLMEALKKAEEAKRRASEANPEKAGVQFGVQRRRQRMTERLQSGMEAVKRRHGRRPRGVVRQTRLDPGLDFQGFVG